MRLGGAPVDSLFLFVRVWLFFQAEDGIRDVAVTGVQTCALPICESVGALFIALGFVTRVSAALTALSMAGALYFSLRVGEASWHLAAVYFLSFVTLALTGPGKFSIDQLLK